MKGLVRALAGISVGIFLHGLVHYDPVQRFFYSIKDKWKGIIWRLDICIWAIIIFYMLFPFHSNADELSVQYDYITVILMFFALIPIFMYEVSIGRKKCAILLSSFARKYAFYAYMGQAVFYSIDKLIYRMEIVTIEKLIILNTAVPFFALIIWFIDKGLSTVIYKRRQLHE